MGTELTAGPPVAANLRKHVAEIAWFHRIDLGGGGVTPGRDLGPERLRRLALPDLSGKSVLDIGAWHGFYSFAAERAGASRVLAVDSYAWSGAGAKEGFEFARATLGSKVEDLRGAVPREPA